MRITILSLETLISVIIQGFILLFGVALLFVILSKPEIKADTTLIAQKKKSTKSKTTINQVSPKIDTIKSTASGYKIEGSDFGIKKNNIQVYEGRSPVSSSSITSVKDNSIEVRRKPGQKVKIYVSRKNVSSNKYEFQWIDPAIVKKKTEPTIEMKKVDDGAKDKAISKERQTKDQATTPTIEDHMITEKKKSTKSKSIENQVSPKIDKIKSTANGYKIEGSGFSNKKNNIQIYEGRSPVSSSSITSVKDNAIEVRRKPGQKVKIYVSRKNVSSNKYEFQWVDPALTKRKTKPITEMKKVEDGTIEKAIIQQKQQTNDTATPDRKKTDQITSKKVEDGAIEKVIVGEQVTKQITKPKLVIPTKKPPVPDDKDDGGIHPIGRPDDGGGLGSGTGGGSTMTAMNTGNAECNTCHLPILATFPFWNWESSEADETPRFVRIKKPQSGDHPLTQGILVDDWEVEFQTSNPNVVDLSGDPHIDLVNMQQGIDIKGPGTATITGLGKFRSGPGNWYNLPTVSRQIVVTAAATQIESFNFAPNPASVPGTTQGIVTFNGGTGEQTWVRWQRAAGPGDARAGGVSEQTVSVPVGASEISFDHQTVDVSGSGTGSGSATIRVRWIRVGSGGFAEEIDQASTTLNVEDAVEIVDSSFSAQLNEIFHDAKCLNCHNFHASNQPYQQHVNDNPPRFTVPQGQSVLQFITNVDNCSSCHSSSLGFADNWHAPPSNMDWSGKNAVQTCNTTVNNTIPQTPQQMKHHLKDDLLIKWAIGRMGSKGLGWNEKFNAWVDGWNGADKNCE
jgi:hypothetical protein